MLEIGDEATSSSSSLQALSAMTVINGPSFEIRWTGTATSPTRQGASIAHNATLADRRLTDVQFVRLAMPDLGRHLDRFNKLAHVGGEVTGHTRQTQRSSKRLLEATRFVSTLDPITENEAQNQ